MSRFRKTIGREVPTLNTASLPDLIFTLLFFFMISTNLKDNPPKVKFDLPHAEEIEKTMSVPYNITVFVGIPNGKTGFSENKDRIIQVNDQLIKPEELSEYMQRLGASKGEKPVVTLKADKQTPMGIIDDIKKSLQEAGIQKIRYAVSDHTQE